MLGWGRRALTRSKIQPKKAAGEGVFGGLWLQVATRARSGSGLRCGAEVAKPFPGRGGLIPWLGPHLQTLTNSGMSGVSGAGEVAVAQTKPRRKVRNWEIADLSWPEQFRRAALGCRREYCFLFTQQKHACVVTPEVRMVFLGSRLLVSLG